MRRTVTGHVGGRFAGTAVLLIGVFVDLKLISDVAREHCLRADPSSITTIEVALDTAHARAAAPVWSALLTGSAEAQGRGSISDDVRDASWRVPLLWFQETEEHEAPRRRCHIEVQVPYDVAEQRSAAAPAAGGVVVQDRDPS